MEKNRQVILGFKQPVPKRVQQNTLLEDAMIER